MEWPYPFAALDQVDQHGFEAELHRELKPGHPLFELPLRALGRRFDQDDVLFEILDGTDRVAQVHLTWTGKEESPPWPATALFNSFEEWTEWVKEESAYVVLSQGKWVSRSEAGRIQSRQESIWPESHAARKEALAVSERQMLEWRVRAMLPTGLLVAMALIELAVPMTGVLAMIARFITLGLLLWTIPVCLILAWSVFETSGQAFGLSSGLIYALLTIGLTACFGLGVFVVPLIVQSDIERLRPFDEEENGPDAVD